MNAGVMASHMSALYRGQFCLYVALRTSHTILVPWKVIPGTYVVV